MKEDTWIWGPAQDRAFSNMKEANTRPTILAHYNPEAHTKISADDSSFWSRFCTVTTEQACMEASSVCLPISNRNRKVRSD